MHSNDSTDTHILECVINDLRMLEVIVREEVELIEEVSNIDAAKWIHLREWQNSGEVDLTWIFGRFIPADVEYLLIVLKTVNSHWHVIVCRDDLLEVITEALLEPLCIFGEQLQEEVVKCIDRVSPALAFISMRQNMQYIHLHA
jgi:hypothetical protein